MGTAKTESTKPVLSLAAVISSIYGGYFFGDRFGEKCIFYMNLTGVTALTVWLGCVLTGGFIGAVLGLLVNKHYIVKKWGA